MQDTYYMYLYKTETERYNAAVWQTELATINDTNRIVASSYW